ncbi:PAS domain-containing hybrid sensor histidine kinase/response regulator [Desulfonatronum thiodismutans]|uniref:PAS domain-containing hybrid sensor histidine kinase/response regulator n=1 Tax=Desulfonatronum thiodismutans TaxID=159290 RepID=UPI00068B7AA0|nr:PAS domain-containing hybrid sensor histidine kinase/response regulator [Desulfonatronum thiodismutans]
MKQTAFETNLHAAPASQEKDDFPPKAALRESEAMPLECLEAAGIGSYVVDLVGAVCNSSTVLNSLLGTPQQEKHLPKIWPSSIHPQWRDQVMRARDEAMKKCERFDQEYKIIRQDDGRERWVHDVGSFEGDDQGKPVRMIGAIRDITEQKKMEQEQEKLQVQLLQAQKMEAVGILTGGVAHNFNNILQTMSGTIELMRPSVPRDHPDIGRLRTLAKSVDRGAYLVRQLLQFSRKAETHKEWMDMNQEVAHVVALLEHVIPRMISVEVRLVEDIWTVNADRVQVEQVLLNLANNAVDAMSDGGRLTIATQNVMIDESHALGLPGVQPGPHVLLTITDTGCGMDKETLEHVFDPFFTTKCVGKGSGLGLATTFEIISGHGGHVACSSEPGLGTTFKIYLSAAPDREAVQDEPEQVAPVFPEGDETIMVVDDEPDIRELTKESLESLGYAVIAVKNGEDALVVYAEKKNTVRLVILDLGMPGMGGRRCLRELRRIDPEVKVLVASGYHEVGLVDEVLKNGAAGFIHKPYQLRDLAIRVRDVLNHDRQEDGEV